MSAPHLHHSDKKIPVVKLGNYPSTAFLPSVALGSLLTRNFGCCDFGCCVGYGELILVVVLGTGSYHLLPHLTTSDLKFSYGEVLPIDGIFAECGTRLPSDAKFWLLCWVLPIQGFFMSAPHLHHSDKKIFGCGDWCSCTI